MWQCEKREEDEGLWQFGNARPHMLIRSGSRPVVFCYVRDVINMTIAHSISTCQTGRRVYRIKHVIRFTSRSFVFCFDDMGALYSSCNELQLVLFFSFYVYIHCQLDLSACSVKCSEVYEQTDDALQVRYYLGLNVPRLAVKKLRLRSQPYVHVRPSV